MKKLCFVLALALVAITPVFADDCDTKMVWDSINSQCIGNPCKDDNANGTCITVFEDVQTRPGSDYKFLILAHAMYKLNNSDCNVSDTEAKFIGQDYVVAYCDGDLYVYEFDDIENNSLSMITLDAMGDLDHTLFPDHIDERDNFVAQEEFNEALCTKALGGEMTLGHCDGIGEKACNGIEDIYKNWFSGSKDVSVNKTLYSFPNCYIYYNSKL